MAKVVHWARNARKYSILLILFLSCVKVFSQDLSGKYCLEADDGDIISRCFTFIENNEFEYKGNFSCGDTGVDYGFGHYELGNNDIKLNFDIRKHNSYHEIVEKTKNEEDSIQVNIKFICLEHKDKLPLVNLEIHEKKTRYKKADSEGNLTVKLKKSDISTKLLSSFVGYNVHDFALTPNVDYTINIYMAFSLGCEVFNETWRYKFKQKSEDYITLKRVGERKIWYRGKERNFRKITEQ